MEKVKIADLDDAFVYPMPMILVGAVVENRYQLPKVIGGGVPTDAETHTNWR